MNDSLPSLSTWIALINYNHSHYLATRTSNHTNHPALTQEFRAVRTTWCDSCFASCSIEVDLTAETVCITCRRPHCQKVLTKPLSSWNFSDPSKDPTFQNTVPPAKINDDINTAIDNTPSPRGNDLMKNASLAYSSSEGTKSRKNRSKARASRSALTDLLTRRKEAQAGSSEQQGAGNLRNFLTQL